MLTAELLRHHWDRGLDYHAYVATGTPDQRGSWDRVYAEARLTPEQTRLVRGFTRQMPVLVSSGTWCGDCVQQCPLLARIAEANPEKVRLRFVDRDQHRELSERVKICGGLRVPTVIWMAEDFEFVSLLGDRTLTRYRLMAERQLGAACPVPGAAVPEEETAAVLQGWLDEFERVSLLLRLSGRLRQKHGD
ncbi:MAG: thioredoxin family protein [Phycisphaerales bacterium]|nr:thioredoxin family protein [Phycisphaerales bacterium]